MNTVAEKLIDAQKKAEYLFSVAEDKQYFVAGQSEKQLNEKLYKLAYHLFGIKKYWHKRIIRAGENTLEPYDENPKNLMIRQDDILFIDFGPVFEDWEADLGRTYVLGEDPARRKLAGDVKTAWSEGKKHFEQTQHITGADFFAYNVGLAKSYGWEFGGKIAGHIIGNFPHKEILGSEVHHYIHPDNHQPMSALDKFGDQRHWIYEIHFVDRQKKMGGFYEQLLTIG